MSAYTSSISSEPILITRARNGDVSAFAVLYEKHRPRIQSVCLRMTNNIAEAEDLTQDAFIYVFRKISTFRGDSAFSTWLHRVTVNTVLMHFRRKNNRHVSLDDPDTHALDTPKYEYGRVDERLARCADRLALIRAIDELPHGYRMIFLLHEVRGYEHQEIARRLHCSIGNSKSQLHKAKLRLRELLAPGGYTHWKKVVLAKPATRRSRVPLALENISSFGLTPIMASAGKDLGPEQPVPMVLLNYEKQIARRKNLTDRSVIRNQGIILPSVRQANSGLMAGSGS